MNYELPLEGCTPTPLAHYLKALGILRLVAEQQDEDAAGRWEGDTFILRSKLDREALQHFFLEVYRPTPVVAPWNGGSGFYPNDNKDGIDRLRHTPVARFQDYKNVIAIAQDTVAIMGLEESPKNEQKAVFLSLVRARLPGLALAWFDAAVMLGSEKPEFPPLLGTGGNDGRLDFTNNFMQRLVALISAETGSAVRQAVAWLDGALWGAPVPQLESYAIGQFAPGHAGGPNATSGFDAPSRINPWDFIFMIEGALLFAGAVTRRLESADSSALSYPFTVRVNGAGSGSSATTDEGQARAEMWMPLWRAWSGVDELRTLFSEGRATLGRKPVKDGLDFARAWRGWVWTAELISFSVMLSLCVREKSISLRRWDVSRYVATRWAILLRNSMTETGSIGGKGMHAAIWQRAVSANLHAGWKSRCSHLLRAVVVKHCKAF